MPTELRDTAIWVATCDLKARVLRNAGRPVLVRALVPGLVLVAVGLAALAVLPPVVGGLIALLGAVVVLSGLSIARRPGHLMLEADGFTYRVLGRATCRSWQSCGEFAVARSGLGPAGHVGWAGAADGRAGGRAGGFLPGAGGLPAEDLAVLLNRYRQRFAPDPTPPV